MTREAELNAEADKKRKEEVETKNSLDSTIYGLEKTLKDSGEKIPAEIKSKFETALDAAKKDLESGDLDKMKAALENLQKIGSELYAAAQAAGAAGGAEAGPEAAAGASASSGKKTEKKADVVDADFEVVDDDQKKS